MPPQEHYWLDRPVAKAYQDATEWHKKHPVIEVTVEKKEGRFTGWVNYTLSRTERSFDAIDNGRWFAARQDRIHDFNIMGMYKLSDRLTLSATWVYYTGDATTFPAGKYKIDGYTANYYSSRDPFEDMSSFGSRTSPVGFYNGQSYDGYTTRNNSSPYGLFDMAGNVWQWVGDIIPGFSDRFMHGGSKDTYDMDLRVWVRNSEMRPKIERLF